MSATHRGNINRLLAQLSAETKMSVAIPQAEDSEQKTRLLQEAISAVRESVVLTVSNEDAVVSDDGMSDDEPGYAPLGVRKANNRKLQTRESWVESHPKYPATDLENVIVAILSRNKKLSGYIKQLVRVVRLAAIVSGNKPYQEFFFSGSTPITASYFKRKIASALRTGLIPPTVVQIRTVPDKEGGRTGAREELDFVEPGMASSDAGKAPFTISYGNIPPIAVALEILWYLLGSDTLQRLLSPVLSPQIADDGAADKVAQKLISTLNAWLDGALGKSNASRQAVIIQHYLVEQRLLKAGVIDDRTIFDFWRKHALGDGEAAGPDYSDKGFKRYRSAATCMLRFERALALSFVEDTVESIDLSQAYQHPDDPRSYFKMKRSDTMEWHSPIIGLFSPPCSRVKWLSGEQLAALNNYLNGCADALAKDMIDRSEEDVRMPDAARERALGNVIAYARLDALDTDNGALMGVDRFNLRFLRTLLRADVFVPTQNKITQALRGTGRKAGRAGTLSANELEELLRSNSGDSYSEAAAAYAQIRGHVVRTALASINHFAVRHHRAGELGPLSAKAVLAVLTLVRGVGSDAVFNHFTFGKAGRAPAVKDDVGGNSVLPELLANVGAALSAVYQGDRTGTAEVDDFIRDVRRSKNQRSGFKEGDELDADVRKGHTAGAKYLVALLGEMDRLDKAVKTSGIAQRAFEEDQSMFAEAFAAIYAV